jgi:predicted amidophosphoribosyltransferase
VPGIKSGEKGWRKALLKRASMAELPEWAHSVDLVASAPPSPLHRLARGFDLAEEAARLLSHAVSKPYICALGKNWLSRRQSKRTESQRRRMPQKNIYVRRSAMVADKTILLVDDVWTTGTTLLRCAKALAGAGAREVRVLALFRAI